jgi:hypothetical protein
LNMKWIKFKSYKDNFSFNKKDKVSFLKMIKQKI